MRVFIPSANGKKASEAAIEFLIFECWNCLAFWTAILQLSNLLGCPAPIPIVAKLLHNTIAFDLTCLHTLKANRISAKSFLLGFNLVTIGSDQRFMSAGSKQAVESIKGTKKGPDSKGY